MLFQERLHQWRAVHPLSPAVGRGIFGATWLTGLLESHVADGRSTPGDTHKIDVPWTSGNEMPGPSPPTIMQAMAERLILPLCLWSPCLSALVLAAAPAAQPGAVSSRMATNTVQDKPNIVFVLFDDMGYGEPPCYRPESPFKMPCLDRLAREGMRFTDAHTSSSVCTPTRYGLLTGRYPWRIGRFDVLQTYSPPIIESSRLTVANLLQQQGYHTACFGKWHLGQDWRGVTIPRGKAAQNAPRIPIGTVAENGPIARGFDVFCGYTHAKATGAEDGIGRIIEQDRVVSYHEAFEVQPLLAKKAVAYIDDRAKAGGPFFLYMPLAIPHLPHVPAPEFNGKSGANDKDKFYADWLFEGDWVTGQIMEALQRNRLAENTLLIVTSDNGAAGRAYPPLRDFKWSIYEGGHRVPFLARWPGKVKPGSVCDDTICLNDLMATCAEIIGVKLPEEASLDGVSILPDLFGTAQGPLREATVHQSSRSMSPRGDNVAIRQGKWKLIFLDGGGCELYDLAADLSETKDVSAAHPDVVARLKGLMQKYVAEGRSTPGAAQRNGVGLERMRALNDHFKEP